MKPVDLAAHPEGGHFREVHRSTETVTARDGRKRSALTHIYFSLGPGEVSRMHRVASDEVWNLYRGDGVRLVTWAGRGSEPLIIILSAEENRYCHVVPAGVWQAAESLSGEALAGCTVAPGFEFSDFALIDPESEEALFLITGHPETRRFIVP
jgi:predicted cupin superfamily sugar epimerase